VDLRATGTVTGTVVDQSGHPLPRAYVRVLDRAAHEIAGGFADEAGRFLVAVTDGQCRVEASLTGFQPSTVACGDAQALRLVLTVAPIHETVVVTATLTATPAGQVGASVTVFTAEDLERRQAPLVADLLRSSPGVMVTRSGGAGTVTSLFVRGGESNYNKVLLDGVPLNEPGGTFNFSNVTTDNLERLEIVRGAESALFGSDAMASVVQLFTRRPDRGDRRPHATASIEGGTYGTLRTNAAVSGAHDRFDYSVGAARYATDNRGPNNAFDNTTLSAHAGVTLSDTATLRFLGRGELGRVGTPGQTAFGRPDLDAFFDRRDGVGGVSFDQQVSPSFRQRATYSLAVSNQQSTNLVADAPYTPAFEGRTAPFEFSDYLYDSRTSLRRHHASYQADWRLSSGSWSGDHLLTVLADWDGERIDINDRLEATTTSPSRNNVGWSIQHQASWRRVFATAGGRLEHNGSFGTVAVPRGSLVFVARTSGRLVGETKLRASAGLGIKEPTVLQSFSLSPYFHGNASLAPERSRSLEAGIEQRLANERVKVEATWFDNRFTNLISTRTTNPATFEAEYFNIGLSRARGAEIAVEAAPNGALRGRAGYTFLASRIVDSTSPDSSVFQPGQPLLRRPRHSGFVGATWSLRRVTADVNGVMVGGFVDSDFSSLSPALLTNAGYVTWDARVAVTLSRQLTGTMSIDNLANARYMEPLGYAALQRTVRVGLRVTF